MELTINTKIVNQTDCKKHHVCLTHPKETVCVAESIVSDTVFVHKKNTDFCRYYKSFGDAGYCTCPVRKEIYKQYSL